MVRSDPVRGNSGKCQWGSARLQNDILKSFRGTSNVGCYNYRNIGGSRSLSLHAEGRAIDIGVRPEFKKSGDDIFALCILYAKELGLQEIIWYRRIWSASKPYIRRYYGQSPHTDHVHIGINWDGASGRTAYFVNHLRLLSVIIGPKEDLDVPKPKDVVCTVNARGGGHYVVTADGAVFAYDGAKYYNAPNSPELGLPPLKMGLNHVVDLVPSRRGKGYFMLGYDGGIFAFGDAKFRGSYLTLPDSATQGKRHFVGMRLTSKGYELIANDKATYRFED